MLRWIHFFLWCSSLLIAGAAWAQGPCDPTLIPEIDPGEGFYRSEVSHGGGLDLVG